MGSAAFNLHVITGVCIASLPNGEKKTIKEGGVFVCTAVISLLAYLWIYVILGGSYELMSESFIKTLSTLL